MDPESGVTGLPAPGTSVGRTEKEENVVQHVIHVLLEKLKTLFEAIAPKNHREVGVENRFYFDQTEKVWKLHGGETEEERREAEALRFHTSRGLSSAYHAPATTACDASRGDWGAGTALPPPPPSAGPVTASMHGACDLQSSALAHPVYAPQGLGAVSQAPRPTQSVQSAPPLANPFGAPAAPAAPGAASAAPGLSGAPLTSPFGAPPVAASAVPLASPFAANMASQGNSVANFA